MINNQPEAFDMNTLTEGIKKRKRRVRLIGMKVNTAKSSTEEF
jgi:hypothetical protein